MRKNWVKSIFDCTGDFTHQVDKALQPAENSDTGKVRNRGTLTERLGLPISKKDSDYEQSIC